MKKLSSLSYGQLDKYDIYSNYKLCANARAAGILAARKKSIKRGFKVKDPYAVKPILTAYRGFKIIDNKTIRIPLGDKEYFDVPLNCHTQEVLASNVDVIIRSFTFTSETISICYSKEIDEIHPVNAAGIDRNLNNLTYGNADNATQYDLAKAVQIAENTRSVTRSFKRNDIRIRRKLFAKYGQRRRNRINQLLHKISKHVVQQAKKNKEALVFEDIQRIRRLYQRGNYQGRNYRARMNSWPFHEVKRQIEYKAAWEGIRVIQLSVKDTRGTSQLCPQCGERLQEDRKARQLWCDQCKKWIDRDVVAVMNLSIKGLARFASSQGLANEAMKRNPTTPVILRVDASKLSFRKKT
jgi:putative transposase